MSVLALLKNIKAPVSIAAIVVVMGYAFYYTHDRWNWEDDSHKIIQHDVNILYHYLPAFFIYDDMSYAYLSEADSVVQAQTWLRQSENGGLVAKMTCGAAIMYSPFFLIGHQAAKIKGLPANGYSWIYHYWITIGAIIYALLALFILRGVLLRYVSDWVAALVLTGLFMGTNLFYYTLVESGMTHVYSFFLFSLLLWLSVRWHDRITWGSTLGLGLVLGLIILIRPTNALVGIVPLLFGVTRISELGHKLKRILAHWPKLLAAGILAFGVLCVQLVYWKSATGDWVYYSYTDEGFFFSNPHAIDGLFSYRKGLFIYTPLMLAAFAGFFFVWKYLQAFFWPLVCFTILNIYVVFSWWCWWYGGSFGSRALIESYALWCIPLALLLQQIWRQTYWRKALVTIFMAGFIYLNLTQTRQYRITLIHWDSMTKAAYWEVFLAEQFPENYAELIQTPDYEAALRGEDEY